MSTGSEPEVAQKATLGTSASFLPTPPSAHTPSPVPPQARTPPAAINVEDEDNDGSSNEDVTPSDGNVLMVDAPEANLSAQTSLSTSTGLQGTGAWLQSTLYSTMLTIQP